MYVAIAIVLVVVVVSVFMLFASDSWPSVEGEVLVSDVEVIHHSAQSNIDSTRGLTRYRFDVKYRYSVDGKRYEGDQLYASLPSIFTDERHVRPLQKQFPPGEQVKVYYRPDNPAQSALLVTGLGVKQKVILLIAIVFSALFVIGGVILFKRL